MHSKLHDLPEPDSLETSKVFWDGLERSLNVLLKICGVLLQITVTLTLPFILWLNLQNGEKIDTAAVKADIAAVSAKEADKTSANNYAITSKWWADRTGNPQDAAKADAAQVKAEKLIETAALAPPP